VWLLVRDHRTLGPLDRALWLLGAQQRRAAGQPLPPPPPDARIVSAPREEPSSVGWLYQEHRVVVLIDARRHCLLQQVGAQLDTLLESLAAGPRLDAVAPEPTTLHVSVALAARAGAPLRVLLQGYRHRCGEPAAPLCATVREQLQLAVLDAPHRRSRRVRRGNGAAPAAAVPHSLHLCVEQGLFCLSLLPSEACPALALLTDCVGSPMDTPVLPLSQRDVALLLLRLPPPDLLAPDALDADGGCAACRPTRRHSPRAATRPRAARQPALVRAQVCSGRAVPRRAGAARRPGGAPARGRERRRADAAPSGHARAARRGRARRECARGAGQGGPVPGG